MIAEGVVPVEIIAECKPKLNFSPWNIDMKTHHRKKKQLKSQPSAAKVMASIFRAADGVIHINFLEKGKQFNSCLLHKDSPSFETKLKGERECFVAT